MSNTSSPSDYLLNPNFSNPSFHLLNDMVCFLSRPSSFIFSAFYMTNISLLLPFCFLIFYYGLKKGCKNCSSYSGATMSHSDSITCHMAIMQLIFVFGCFICIYGIHKVELKLLFVGVVLNYFGWFGETFFHTLTCVDRYLAVVHPITYLSLRKERGIRIRKISIGCVWLICCVELVLHLIGELTNTVQLCILIISLTVISFCNLSVLCVLIHPGPGDQGGNRVVKVDQSKQRAFYTIMAILGVLLLKFAWGLVWVVNLNVNRGNTCVLASCGAWFNLPCSLVLPLLFLQKNKKIGLQCIKTIYF